MIIALEQLNLSLNALQFLKTNNYEHTENIADLKFRKFKNSYSHMQFTDSAEKKMYLFMKKFHQVVFIVLLRVMFLCHIFLPIPKKYFTASLPTIYLKSRLYNNE